MEIKGPTLPGTLSTSVCITPISFSRSTAVPVDENYHLLDPEGYFVRKRILHYHVHHVNLHVHHNFGHLVKLHVHHPHQFYKVLVWYVRLEGSESSTVSQSVSKVGLELLGQLKIMSAINIS